MDYRESRDSNPPKRASPQGKEAQPKPRTLTIFREMSICRTFGNAVSSGTEGIDQ